MTLSQSILYLTKDPNLVGEILRDRFFKQNRELGIFGCYTTFNLRDDVVKLEDEVNLEYGYENEGVKVTCAKLDDIVMKYFWCGDGTLTFHFPNGEILENDDCKKDHGWMIRSIFLNKKEKSK